MAASLPLALTTALSSYGLYLSYQNITRLQQYEKVSQKAAEWSNTAAHRLHKTRTTQTSGTVALLLSLVTSATLLTPLLSTPSTRLAAAVLNAALAWAARTHMAAFWNEAEQTRIPFVEKFNEAIRGSESVVSVLGGLSCAWAATGVVWVGWYWGGAGR